jgi:hypothetical protein
MLALQVGWPMALAAAALIAAVSLALAPLVAAWAAAWPHGDLRTVLYALGIAACLLVDYVLFVAVVVAIAVNAKRRRK